MASVQRTNVSAEINVESSITLLRSANQNLRHLEKQSHSQRVESNLSSSEDEESEFTLLSDIKKHNEEIEEDHISDDLNTQADDVDSEDFFINTLEPGQSTDVNRRLTTIIIIIIIIII